MPIIFHIKFYDLIKTILDLALNSSKNRLETRFICLSEDFLDNEFPFQICGNTNLESPTLPPPPPPPQSILFLINDSKKPSLLIHETTHKLLYAKWRYMPRYVYYFNLTVYLLLLIFYTIQALNYIQDAYELAFHSSIVCTILLVYFIFLKCLHLKNIGSFLNSIELANFLLCLIVLYLPQTDYKSCLLSLSCVLSYGIFVSRLDKFYRIGIFVKVFGKIIRTSLGVIIIILIMLIGYTLSITVRSRFFEYLKRKNATQDVINELQNFEFSFENNLYTMMTYMCGQIVTTGMGVDKLNASSLVVFVIYGTFMFCMTILFYNIFVGIATYEIREILYNSKIEITLTKIEYIYGLERGFRHLNAYKWMSRVLKIVEDFYLKKIFFLKIRKKNGEEKMEEKSDEIKKLRQANDRLLIELKQMSSLMLNKFEFIEKRIELIENFAK